MPFDYTVHRPVKGGDEHQVTVNPYIQITGQDGSFLLRDGLFWSADGEVIPEDAIPDWVLDEVDRMTPAGRLSVGFPAEVSGPAVSAKASKAPKG